MNQSQYRERERYIEDRELEEEREQMRNGSHCSFCGEPMEEDEMFCSECGAPRGGITCPNCGTLNHGSFCSVCNTPLDDAARLAVKLAKEDPDFIEAQELADELVELEELIARLQQEETRGKTGAGNSLDTSTALSEKERETLKKYNDLFAGIGDLMVKPVERKPVADAPKAPASGGFSVKTVSLKEAVERYKKVAKQLQAKLDAMLPEPSATPQEQRNFFSARKIRLATTKQVPQYWICNFCGCHHSQPSECAEPWQGGRWIYETKMEYNDLTVYD